MSAARTPSGGADAVAPGEGFSQFVRDLSLPHPDRVRVVRELASDVEELEQELRSRGMAPQEARERAETMLLPRGPALDALERIHRPLYARLTGGFSPGLMRRWERTALGLVGAVGLGVALAGMARGNPLHSPSASAFLIPVLALGVASVVASLAKGFQLFVKRDHAPGRLGAGIMIGPAFAAAAVLLAATGFLVDLFRLAVAMESGPAQPGRLVLEFVSGTSALLAASLVLTLLSGLLWYPSAQWLAHVEQAERRLRSGLGSDSPTEMEIRP